MLHQPLNPTTTYHNPFHVKHPTCYLQHAVPSALTLSVFHDPLQARAHLNVLGCEFGLLPKPSCLFLADSLECHLLRICLLTFLQHMRKVVDLSGDILNDILTKRCAEQSCAEQSMVVGVAGIQDVALFAQRCCG